jgi:signal transduction histidine kinase
MNSLRTRILVVIAGFGLITAILLTGIMYASIRSYYINVQYDTAREFAQRLAETHPDLMSRLQNDSRGVGDLLSQYVLLSPKTGLYMLDDEGRVLSSAGEGKIFWGNYKVGVAKVKQSIQNDPTVPIYSDDPDALGKGCIVAAYPLPAAGGGGWIYVVARSADLSTVAPELLASYTIRIAVKVGLVTLALGIALTLLMMTVLTRPLTELTTAAERIQRKGSSGSNANAGDTVDLDLPFASRKDEIGKLSNAFRDLVSRLRLEVARVTQGDAQRREMIASVSHDVRTPLTALIAQLETIRLKGKDFPLHEQHRLFDQALGNTFHLKKLTDSLAELAYLDSPEVKAVMEPMPICELSDDIVQRFIPRAESDGMKLKLDFKEGLPRIPVDAGLFDRALSNLIDNALRYSPKDGTVSVAVELVRAGAIRVSVKDEGPGLALADQGRVFERFYQGSTHRSLRGSSGLGLAIVKRVAELHHGRVGVTSELGNGASFWLELQV